MTLKPKALRQGDTIGIIAPASPFYYKSALARGVYELEQWGYNVKLGKYIYEQMGYLAGSDEQRAHDVNEMFKDDEVDAIMVTGGGYGTARLVDKIDYDVIKKNPKIITGYSDITTLHIAIHQFTGLTTFHGPGLLRLNREELTEYTKEQLLKAITTNETLGEIKRADERKWLHTFFPGEARGEIVGGNLALISASLGTEYEIDTKGKILFIEEWNMEPWQIDHFMNHLYNAGKLHDAVGIVFGECVNCIPFNNIGFENSLTLEEIFEHFTQLVKKPAFYGLPLGHTNDLATIPIGAKAYVNATKRQLIIEESGVL